MSKRYCVVTPYHKESRDLIDRCLQSVRGQSVPVEHIVVADGHPQDWLDAEPIRHIRLDRSHRDYGNTARGIGALLAVAESYDGIAYLDADNWYDPDHIAACLEAGNTDPTRPDFVTAQRRFVRPDRSVMPLVPADKPHADHIDTNCYFFLPKSYYAIAKWCTIPQEMSQHGDKIFYYFCVGEQLTFAITNRRTVNYTCMFDALYKDINEEPPPGAKPLVDWNKTREWLASLAPEDFTAAQRRTGLHLK